MSARSSALNASSSAVFHAARIIIHCLSYCAHRHSLPFILHVSSFAVFPGIHTFVRVGLLLFHGDFYISFNHIFTGNLFFDLLGQLF